MDNDKQLARKVFEAYRNDSDKGIASIERLMRAIRKLKVLRMTNDITVKFVKTGRSDYGRKYVTRRDIIDGARHQLTNYDTVVAELNLAFIKVGHDQLVAAYDAGKVHHLTITNSQAAPKAAYEAIKAEYQAIIESAAKDAGVDIDPASYRKH